MRYVAASMLVAMGAKHHHFTAADMESMFVSVGVRCDREKADEILKKLQGKSVDELITEGSKYLSSVSVASAVPAGASAAAAAPADAKGDTAPAAEKKEEKKEKEEESDEDMGFGLFD